MMRSAQHAFEPEEIMTYLDGEAEPRQAMSILTHLEECSECQALAKQFRDVSERMLHFQAGSCPPSVDKAVLHALEAREPNESHLLDFDNNWPWNWRRLFANPYAWALTCVLIAVSIIAVGHLSTLRESALSGTAPQKEPLKRELATSKSYRAWLNQDLIYTVGTGSGAGVGAKTNKIEAPEFHGPMIVETAAMTILASNYSQASSKVEPLTAARGGYIQELKAETPTGAARSLSVTLRVPEKQLEGFLADLRRLGHVEQETQNNQEVTDQYVDLEARLRSARATEERLIELLKTRTGKLADVLEAENELARVRSEIESMEGQRASLVHRVDYANVQVELREEYRESLHSEPFSARTRMWNSFVEGSGNLGSGVVAMLVFVLAYGPSILFWFVILGIPAWLIGRRVRSHSPQGS